jgi:hypothetical protein
MRYEGDAANCCSTHSGQVIEAREKLVIKLKKPFVLVTSLFWLEREQQQILLIETDVDVLQVVESTDEQPCANQQKQESAT